jgi:hypothetical protein
MKSRSSFLLSITSLNFRGMFCGEFREGQVDQQKKLVLDEGSDLRCVLDMWCGNQLNVDLNEAL